MTGDNDNLENDHKGPSLMDQIHSVVIYGFILGFLLAFVL